MHSHVTIISAKSGVKMFKGIRLILSSDTLLTPIHAYVIAKLIFPITKFDDGPVQFVCYELLRGATTIIILTAILTLLVIYAIYFEIAVMITKFVYGHLYVETCNGADAAWAQDTHKAKGIINIFTLFEDKPNTPEKLLELLRDPDVQGRAMRLHPRFACLRKRYLGYSHFIRKENIDLNKIVRYFDEDYSDTKEFHQVVNRMTSTELPYDNEFLWEMLIGKVKIEMEPGAFHYPLIWRVHHCVADGIALTAFVGASYMKNGITVMREECNNYTQMMRNIRKKQKVKAMHEGSQFNGILKKCKQFLSKDYYLAYDFIRMWESENILHCAMSGSKLVAHALESKSDGYIAKIKQIKNKLGVQFSDVVTSAIAASVSAHFGKYDSLPPTQIISGNIYYMNSTQFEAVFENIDGEYAARLGNKFVVAMMPMHVSQKFTNHPKELILRTNDVTKRLKNSWDLMLTSWLLNTFATISPEILLAPIKLIFDPTTIVSNIPGAHSRQLKNGLWYTNQLIATIHHKLSGVSIGVYQFNELLRITVFVDKALIADADELQMMTNDILSNIDKFYQAICA